MDNHHETPADVVPQLDGLITAEQHPQLNAEHEIATAEQGVASAQTEVPYQDIEVAAAEDAEVVDDPRMRVLCEMHNEMMSTMNALTYQPQLYPKAQHMASVLFGNEDLPTVIRVHALMVLGVAEEKAKPKAGEPKVPVGKEALKGAIGLVKKAAEAGELKREGAEGMIGVCLQSMGVKDVPEWAKVGDVETYTSESS